MIRLSAATRISLTLACLCLSLLFAAQTLGLIPDQSKVILQSRKTFCKAVASQACWAAQKEDIKGLKAETARLMEKNEGVLSVAVLRANGQYLVRLGEHPSHLPSSELAGSRDDRVEIPIYKGRMPWGKVQICFRPINGKGWAWWFTAPVRLILCLTLSTFLLSRLYLKRVLHHLDPSSVIPDRVRSTLDTLAEGVLIVDGNQQIVLANKAFADKCGRTRDELQGLQMAELKWTRSDKEAAFPWQLAISENAPQIGALLTMQSTPHRKATFVVNATPVLGTDGSPRGAMVTFDDVTSIEEKNQQLEEMLQSLKTSFDDVRQKNSELKLLAARDPLTNCLNRRSLFDAFVVEWQSAAAQGSFLSCIMVDVDHFKNINDEYGHTAGDEVLRELSAALLEGVRQTDFVGATAARNFACCFRGPRSARRRPSPKSCGSASPKPASAGASRPASACRRPRAEPPIRKNCWKRPIARCTSRRSWGATGSRPGRPPLRPRPKTAGRSPARVRARRRCMRAFPSRRSTP